MTAAARHPCRNRCADQTTEGHGRRATDPNFCGRSPGAHARRFL